MQASIKRFFRKDSTLMWSILIGSILWLTNAAFIFAAKDYRAFCINLLYVICLLTLGGATFRQEKEIVQGMIGALMMVSVIGNVNVLSEMLDTMIPSRSLKNNKQRWYRREEIHYKLLVYCSISLYDSNAREGGTGNIIHIHRIPLGTGRDCPASGLRVR